MVLYTSDKEENITHTVQIINNETGEVEERYGVFRTKDQIEGAKKYFKKEETKKKVNNIHKQYGEFTWLIFKYCEELLPDIEPHELTKLMYLSTYINYDNVFTLNNKAMTYRDMNFLLMINRDNFRFFYTKMRDKEMFVEKDNTIEINKEMLYRGDLPKKIQNNFIRLKHETIQDIYKSTNSRQHGQLSYIFRLIPYINKQYNIICFNPTEEDYRLVKPMCCSDYADIVKYDKSNIAKLEKSIMTYMFRSQPLVKIYEDKLLKDQRIFINPELYYAGDDYKKVEILRVFC